MWGQTAKQWRVNNPNRKGNIRDYASLQQLLVLANIESYNAILISQGLSQAQRIYELRKVAVMQLRALEPMNMGALPNVK